MSFTLPAADHPVWKILQVLLGLVVLLLVGEHGNELAAGTHKLDATDAVAGTWIARELISMGVRRAA